MLYFFEANPNTQNKTTLCHMSILTYCNFHLMVYTKKYAKAKKQPQNLNKETEQTMQKNILIIEDDSTLANGLCRALAGDEINAESCRLISEARHKLSSREYALVVLDINLPDGNGFDFLSEIKQKYDTPVIILTANDMETDIVAGLEAGADDYITKPFSLAVLRARVNTQLRKDRYSHTKIKIDGYSFDFENMEYFFEGAQIELSKTEQKLLRYLVENRGNTLSREFLIDHIWTDGAEYVDENALSVSIKRLRDKLSAQDYIKTVYGVGYSWKI